jgi:hypothetical protein
MKNTKQRQKLLYRDLLLSTEAAAPGPDLTIRRSSSASSTKKDRYGQKRNLQWQKSASHFAFAATEDVFSVKIPFSTPIYQRVFGRPPRISPVFHVTSPDAHGIGRLLKLEGKKKTISAFLNARGDILVRGIQAGGGVIAEMEADVLVAGSEDIMSRPDGTGRRWIDFDNLAIIMQFYRSRAPNSKIMKDAEKKMLKDFHNAFRALVKKYTAKEDYKNSPKNPIKGWFLLDPASQTGLRNILNKKLGIRPTDRIETNKIKKIQHEMIKDYIDAMESVLKKNAQAVKESIQYHLMSRKLGSSVDAWDELVVNNIQIKKIHLLSDILGKQDIPGEFKTELRSSINDKLDREEGEIYNELVDMLTKKTGLKPIEWLGQDALSKHITKSVKSKFKIAR